MDTTSLLDLCLKVTGTFEAGTPSVDALCGNDDGCGMSCGLLQWNAGQGTLQQLVGHIGDAMGWDRAKSFFSCDIEALRSLNSAAAIAFTKQHFLKPKSTRLTAEATSAWKAFLNTPESTSAQRLYAETTTLAHAQAAAKKYVPEFAERTRSVAFFFDVINQQGSMKNLPVAIGNGSAAIVYANDIDPATALLWRKNADPLAQHLLFYAYERAHLARPEYVWDSLSRRGAIAARRGFVHRTHIDLTSVLD